MRWRFVKGHRYLTDPVAKSVLLPFKRGHLPCLKAVQLANGRKPSRYRLRRAETRIRSCRDEKARLRRYHLLASSATSKRIVSSSPFSSPSKYSSQLNYATSAYLTTETEPRHASLFHVMSLALPSTLGSSHLAIGLPQTLSSIKLGSTPRRSSSNESEMRFCARLRLISAGVDAARPGDNVLNPLYSSRSLRRLLRPLKDEEGPNWRILLPSRLTSTRVRQRLSPRRFPMLLPWITFT